jgi:hypothetical protein
MRCGFVAVFLTFFIFVLGVDAATPALSKRDGDLLLARLVESSELEDYVLGDGDLQRHWILALLHDSVKVKLGVSALKDLYKQLTVELLFYSLDPLLPEVVKNLLNINKLLELGKEGLKQFTDLLYANNIRTVAGDITIKTKAGNIFGLTINGNQAVTIKYIVVWQKSTGYFSALFWNTQTLNIVKTKAGSGLTRYLNENTSVGAFKLKVTANIKNILTSAEDVTFEFTFLDDFSFDPFDSTKLPSANQAPNAPNTPYPNSGATSVETNTVISWTGGDPNSDTVTYDVYFGTTNPPLVKVSTAQTPTSYKPTLALNKTYFWKVAAKDSKGAVTDGPLWSFTTGVPAGTVPPPTPPPGKPSWPMAQGNAQRTGQSKSLGPTNEPQIKWKFDKGATSLAIDESGFIYLGNFYGVFSLNPSDGSVRWNFKEAGMTFALAISSDNTVFAISQLGLVALDTSGKKLWQYPIGVISDARPATIGNEVLVFAKCVASNRDEHSTLLKISSAGALKWAYDLDVEQLFTNSDYRCALDGASGGFSGGGPASPAIDSSGNIYLGMHAKQGDNDILYSLTSAGILNWKREYTQTDIRGRVATAIVVPDGTVFLPYGRLHSINPASGEVMWKDSVGVAGNNFPLAFDSSSSTIFSTYQYYDQTVFSAANAKTGEQKWSRDLGKGGVSPPIVDRVGNSYVYGSYGLRSYDALGNERWHSLEVGSLAPSYVTMAIGSDGTLYFAGEKLYALSSTSQSQASNVDTKNARITVKKSDNSILEVVVPNSQQIRLEIFGLSGQRIFDSGFTFGSTLRWKGLITAGRPVANGVYLYVITARGNDGKVTRSAVRMLIILR